MKHTPSRSDPTLVRNQPALTTSNGLIWLIVGGIAEVAFVGTLAALVAVDAVVAVVGIVIDVALYVGMVTVRFAVPSGVRRLRSLAALFLTAAACTLVAVLIINVAAR